MRLRVLVVFILLLLVPLTTFAAGYRLGNRQVIVVRADAPVVQNGREMFIGTVAGTKSAEMQPSPMTKITSIKNISDENKTDNHNGDNIWSEVNKYRQMHGLPSFNKDGELCKLTDIRLSDLESKGALDNHAGFRDKTEEFLKQKGYHKIAENIAQGFVTAAALIAGWDGSVGHRALLQAADMDHGCSSAGGGFAVLIVAKK